MSEDEFENKSELIMYQTEDGITKIEVTLEDETVWLSQSQMSELFQRERSVITKHIQNIFNEGELDEKSNVQILHITNSYKPTTLYNLDVIISVGYRVKSLRGTQFRIWANKIIKEYMIKGFTMNDELLKRAGGGNYFKELLERIRDIRSSEKVFYRQILDIYSTSIDYDPSSPITLEFFKIVQNKMHWAAHGHTAAELISERVNADKPFMGLTAFSGEKPKKSEVIIAKNYLGQDEIKMLNAVVSSYLEFAEMQALSKKPMYMKNWIDKLDDFLKMGEKDILTTAGKITHEQAEQKALKEYDKYKKKSQDELTKVEIDFIDSIKKTQRLLSGKKE